MVKIEEKTDSYRHVGEHGTYYVNKSGLYHKRNGPAVEWENEEFNGEKEWWLNGKRHRSDGPSIIFKVKYSFDEDNYHLLDHAINAKYQFNNWILRIRIIFHKKLIRKMGELIIDIEKSWETV